MNYLLTLIATLCHNNSFTKTSLRDQLNCQTELVQCIARREIDYLDYDDNRMTIQAFECIKTRKQK